MLSERCPVALCIASFLFLHVQAMPAVINAYPSSESEEFFQDNWDYKVGQSKTPLLQKLQQKNHTLPPTANETARLLWELDQEKTTHLPQFVDQALKMLSLKRVAFEIENSMMSKVSCTACKADYYVK
jgi:hypothetical protein